MIFGEIFRLFRSSQRLPVEENVMSTTLENKLPTDHHDPITGEPDAHPVGVGVGALGAGVAGAAIGALGGPVGVMVGAVIGAAAGGLAGHEVASTASEPQPSSALLDEPLPTASSGLITPNESSFLADSTSADSGVTGEAPLVTESALPAAFAVNADAETPTRLDEEETVRETAFYRFLERESTGRPGSEFNDWIEAENDVRRR